MIEVRKGQVWQRGAKGRHVRITDVYSEWADFVGVDDGKKGSARRSQFGKSGPLGYRLVQDASPPARQHGSEARGLSPLRPVAGFGMPPPAVQYAIEQRQAAHVATASPAPSPLARVREVLASPHMPRRLTHDAMVALAGLTTLEHVFTEAMQALHVLRSGMVMTPGNGVQRPHSVARWESCPECRAMLEAK